MSQSAPAAAPATTSSTTPTPPAYVDTPALLSRLGLVAVVTVVVFGALSALLQVLAWQSDGRAADDTEQLVRVQGIESSLLRADALATNGYLLAGLEPTARQHDYADAIGQVLSDIADAAEAQPADRAALAALNQQVEQYTADVAQAAVYDRMGFPLGIAYQQAASNQLRTATQPIVDGIVAANQQRSRDAMDGHHPVWLLGLGVLALAVLLLVNRRLARAFRRRFNPGVAIAALIVLVTTLVTVAMATAAVQGNRDTRDGAYRRASDAATARTAANDAKAFESLRLINRGSGSVWEPKWDAARAVVEHTAPARDLGSWRTYVARHEVIVHLDDTNQWKRAVVAATRDGASGSSAPLDTFDETMAAVASTSGHRAAHELRSGRSLALVVSLLSLLLGLGAAVAVTRGIGERQKEFL